MAGRAVLAASRASPPGGVLNERHSVQSSRVAQADATVQEVQMVNQVALVSETDQISSAALNIVGAAVQKQVSRDLGPIWNIDASVNVFEKLEDVPLGYWQVIIRDDIPFDAGGIHLNTENGQPFALVRFSNDWSLTVSHEIAEMLVDPSGNRTVAANSPKPDQGRVLILVEISDPSEAAKFGYTVNGVLVSDFYTPAFFDPVEASGVRYSFTGAITAPRQVRDGGYISWWDPETSHVFQLFVRGTNKQFVDRGPVPQGFGTLRSFTDTFTNQMREDLKKAPPAGAMLTAAVSQPLAAKRGAKRGAMRAPTANKVDRSTASAAARLRHQVDSLLKR
jgi:hypothetical protein